MSGNLLGREVTAEDVAQAFPRPGAGAEDHRRRHHRRWRQYCGRIALARAPKMGRFWRPSTRMRVRLKAS